jgi:hypothetical protein
MKKIAILLSIVLTSSILLSSCKKDYTCKAISPSGDETDLKCTNCSKKQVQDYQNQILAQGYSSVTCAK